jgi:alpha-tubulin suppressor-like RCC1 family protein
LRTLTKTQRVAALGTLVVTLSWLTSPADPVLRIDGVDGGGEGGVFGDLQDTANPPVQDRTAVQLQGGDRFFCTVMDNAQIKCWGNNLSSQLGTADNYRFHGTDVSNMGDDLPIVQLGTGRTAVQVSTGVRHACAILDNGSVKCWGRCSDGSCGVNTSFVGDVPGDLGDALPAVDLGTGRTAVELSLGDDFSCARLDDNTVKCWGKNNRGQLGQGFRGALGVTPTQMGDALLPVELGTDRTAVRIDAGYAHVCAILDNRSSTTVR